MAVEVDTVNCGLRVLRTFNVWSAAVEQDIDLHERIRVALRNQAVRSAM